MSGGKPATIENGRVLTEAELVRIEAEREAPIAVSRLFADFTDFDLRVFAMKCAGMPISRIADNLDVSPDRVRKSVKAKSVVHDWLDEVIPSNERDRAEKERLRAQDEMLQEYESIWPDLIVKLKEAMDGGDKRIIAQLHKDLSARLFGNPSKRVAVDATARQVVDSSRAITGSVANAVSRVLDEDDD